MEGFLSALQAAETGAEECCLPPGLGSVFRVRWIRSGLRSGAVVVHHSGLGLALHIPSSHRSGTCTCTLCRWELGQKLEDEQSRPISRDQVQELAQRIAAASLMRS